MLSIQGGVPSTASVSLGAKPLSETQQQGLDDLLSNYDAETLSDDDAKSLVDGIKDLEIQRGSALAEALGAAGFNAADVAAQAGIAGGGPSGAGGPPGGGGGPGGPGGGGGGGGAQGAKGPDSAAAQTLQSVVEQLEEAASESDSDEDFSTLLKQALEEAGLDTSQSIVDYRV